MHLKRVVRRQGQFWLWSENLEHPSELATEEDVPIATRRQVIRPEQMAPERLAEGPLQELFGWVDAEGGSGAVRHGGHLFVLLDVAGQAVEPTQVVLSVPDWRPSETAFVCHRSGDGWRYLGVGRTANGRDWVIPEMDFLAWSVLRREGASGGLSRALPPEAEEVARAFVASMPVGARRSRDGKEVQVLGKGVRGGLKLRSGQWKNERSVSLADIGWVLVARDGLPPGGVLDEASVNRSRYIEGTPRASTRWVDTGNALVLVIGT